MRTIEIDNIDTWLLHKKVLRDTCNLQYNHQSLPRLMLTDEMTLYLVYEEEAQIYRLINPEHYNDERMNLIRIYVSKPLPKTIESLTQLFPVCFRKKIIQVSQLNFREESRRIKNIFDLHTSEYFLNGTSLMIVKDLDDSEYHWYSPEVWSSTYPYLGDVEECLIFKSNNKRLRNE